MRLPVSRSGGANVKLSATAVSPMNCSTAVDPDKVLDLVAVAAVLARRRTDPAHLRRERVGVGGAPERVLLPAHALGRLLQPPHHLEPAPHVLAGRAAPLARRRTVHVGRALVGVVRVEDSRFEIGPVVVAVTELAEGVAFGAVGLAPGGRHARSLVRLSLSGHRGILGLGSLKGRHPHTCTRCCAKRPWERGRPARSGPQAHGCSSGRDARVPRIPVRGCAHDLSFRARPRYSLSPSTIASPTSW